MSPEVSAWFATWWPLWSPFALLVVGGSVTGIWLMVNRRDGERAARKAPLPPTWPEMWARLDAQDVRIEALENDLAESKEEVRGLRSETRRKDDQIDELITHILKLEHLIPTPPGPPARPSWIKR